MRDSDLHGSFCCTVFSLWTQIWSCGNFFAICWWRKKNLQWVCVICWYHLKADRYSTDPHPGVPSVALLFRDYEGLWWMETPSVGRISSDAQVVHFSWRGRFSDVHIHTYSRAVANWLAGWSGIQSNRIGKWVTKRSLARPFWVVTAWRYFCPIVNAMKEMQKVGWSM